MLSSTTIPRHVHTDDCCRICWATSLLASTCDTVNTVAQSVAEIITGATSKILTERRINWSHVDTALATPVKTFDNVKSSCQSRYYMNRPCKRACISIQSNIALRSPH